MIPKIIHYCWLSGERYPKLVKDCMKSWQEKLPGWEFRLWDKSCLEEIDVAWVHEAYQAKVYSHAADYIRLYAVYKYGGFYLDSDVEVLKDFSSLCSLPYVFGMENGSGNIEAATFGAEPGNILIKKCMEYYHDRHFVNPDGTKNISIIVPIVLRIVLLELMEGRIVDDICSFPKRIDKVWVFPIDYFSPKNMYGECKNMSRRTYSIHHFRGSWHPWWTGISIRIRRLLGHQRSEPIFYVLAKMKGAFNTLKTIR